MQLADDVNAAMLKMYNRLSQECHKGPNRMIAVIREEARAFDKAHPEYIEGGFLKFAKKHIQEGVEWPEEFKAALKYL